MTYLEALDAIAGDRHVGRYRELCAEDNPDQVQRDAYRQQVIDQALEGEVPPILERAGSALVAAGRVLVAMATGLPVYVTPEVFDERFGECSVCDFNTARPLTVHCMKCGCPVLKLRLASQECPIGKWKRTDGA
jgi:hypothetical protein